MRQRFSLQKTVLGLTRLLIDGDLAFVGSRADCITQLEWIYSGNLARENCSV
jgi:hypothetical protein